ncbi:MAG: hypothetical protein WCO57_12985 [Verrucomicrobiota bacterium]
METNIAILQFIAAITPYEFIKNPTYVSAVFVLVLGIVALINWKLKVDNKITFYICFLAAVSCAGFYSYDHSERFKTDQAVRLAAIAENKIVTANAEVTEKQLKDEQGVLKTVQIQREETKQSIAALKSKEVKFRGEIAELDKRIGVQNEELAELDKTLAEIKLILTELGDGVTVENIAEYYNKITDNKKALERTLEEKETLVAGAEKRLADSRAEEARLTNKKMARNVRIGRNAMESVITGVNQDWGFVVIGAGSNTGFTPQTSLLVKRDGRLIGRVRPTAIESTQTIADIDLESLASGVRLQTGDRVILAKPESN